MIRGEELALGTPEPPRYGNDAPWMGEVVIQAKHLLVWLAQLSQRYGAPIRRLDEIPDQELHLLAQRGVSALWPIGIWRRSAASRSMNVSAGDLDAEGSAYAVAEYVVDEQLGGNAALAALRTRAGAVGIRIVTDMVPNHVAIDGRWANERPELLLSSAHPPFKNYRYSGENLSAEPGTAIRIEDGYERGDDAAVAFERRAEGSLQYIYHGNDGTNMPWKDTAQIDYLNAEAREAVIQEILSVARRSDIIRFDAAMTLAAQHIRRLWYPARGTEAAIPSRSEFALSDREFAKRLPREFWREVVERVERELPGTMLLAEAFWLLEGYFVRGLGMHRVYNSAFMTMLRDGKNAEYRTILRDTVGYDPELLRRYVNFLTTPDEEPAAVGFGIGDRALLAATLAATLPGVPMLGHGQWEGQRERYGMEYRAPRTSDPISADHVERYDREIAPLLRARHLFAGVADFRWFDAKGGSKGARESAYAFSNAAGSARSLVIALNSDAAAELTIHHASPAVAPSSSLASTPAETLPASTIADRLGISARAGDVVELRDAITNRSLLVSTAALTRSGLTVRLPAFGRVVFWGIAQHHSTPSEPWGDLAAQAKGELLHDPATALAALTNSGAPADARSARIEGPAGTSATGRKRVTERKSTSGESTADPRLLTTETPAPPEAVRAIAALLGRAAAPLRPERRATPPAPVPTTAPEVQAPIESLRDHEVLVEGEHSDLLRLAAHEIDRVKRRAKRSRQAVREALARISTPGGDELGG
jgi:glycosidase|uniref:alpha-amylase family glycosyl hydrolase n=1 Tax=Candidatus Limnocylindrus sp. TaxID=2802978 RepID=UPI00404B0A9A